MKAKGKKVRAQPVRFSQELADRICDRLADGETLRAICRDAGMPDERTVRRWSLDAESPFKPQYARAREIGYHRMADEIIEIADDGTNDYVERKNKDGETHRAFDAEQVQRSRLRVEARKWLLSKALPKVYGDRLDLNASVGLRESHDDFVLMLHREKEKIRAEKRDDGNKSSNS
jgi:hypothetical protein